ncbi:hypothetical protein SCLCIDRAFT_1220841 [Scleroderma citrinum Foug A]|uniref:Uncharacterized protein n=1 Tax=Scleroderma citrinum Foug A TaxID=1036808 RepID=A0A0C3DIG0_9AGAM|nr:hypothetical protein SCLCIDRAFT_1220841 [Scleroderma citrinum Foug A]
MVRFLGVASLVLFLQIALVSAQNEDAHARTRIGSQDACAYAQRAAMAINAAPQAPFVATTRDMDVRAWIQQ